MESWLLILIKNQVLIVPLKSKNVARRSVMDKKYWFGWMMRQRMNIMLGAQKERAYMFRTPCTSLLMACQNIWMHFVLCRR